MFINYLLPKKYQLKYSEIDVILNIAVFFIGLWATFVSINGISNYSYVSSTLSFYLFVDMFFLPFHKLDMIFHHLIVIFLLYQGIGSTQRFHNQITTLLMMTEASSIVLGPGYIIRKYRRDYPSLSSLMNIAFAISFVYFRILNLTYGLVFDMESFYVLKEKFTSTKSLGFWTGTTSLASLLGLQYYWLYQIIRVLLLKNKKKK
jgi:hypothetical protein